MNKNSYLSIYSIISITRFLMISIFLVLVCQTNIVVAEGGPPAILIDAEELRGANGVRHSTPKSVPLCSSGTEFRFKIFLRSHNGIKDLSTVIRGEGIRQGVQGQTLHDGSSHSLGESLNFNVDVNAPLELRPHERSGIRLVVYLIEDNEYRTEKSFSIGLGPRPSYQFLQTRIDRPRNPSIISSGANWQIAGNVQTDPVLGQCGDIRPEQVELWHTAPGSGTPRKISSARLDPSGRFIFPIRPRTIPVGDNIFNVQAVMPVAESSSRPDSRQSTLNVTITSLNKDTVNKVNEPLSPKTRNQIPRPNLPGVPLDKSSTGADKVKRSTKNPHNESIQREAIDSNVTQEIN